MKLTDFDTLTFDCYGTLIDWETGIFEGLRPLLERVNPPLTRDQVLEAHARHESSQQAYTPAKRYQELLPIVYKRMNGRGMAGAFHARGVPRLRQVRT